MRSTFSMAMIALVLATTGCRDVASTRADAHAENSVPYITADEFADALESDGDLLLVEFCVPVGCFRCDDTRPQIDRLAAEQRDRLTIRRVNLNQEPDLTRQLGVSVCPSYVAFRDGEEVFRAAYPTSADLIVAGLDDSLRNSSVE